MEPIDWLQVILDYGKRFPNETMGSLGLEVAPSVFNLSLSALKRKEEDAKCLIFDCYTPFHSYFRLYKPIDYWHGDGINTRWKSVPQHILLKLLTEGKEDLI